VGQPNRLKEITAVLSLLISGLVIGAAGVGDSANACSIHGMMHHSTKSSSLVQIRHHTEKVTSHTESMFEEIEDTDAAAALILHARPSPAGSDSSGCGSKSQPFATVRRAVEENIQKIEKATQPTMLYVSGTFPPPTAPHGGDTSVTVTPPDSAPLIITLPPGSTARFEGRARISDLM